MSKHGLLGKLLAISVGLLVLGASADADARKWAKKKAAPAAEPAALEKAPKLKPSRLKFGMSEKAVIKAYGKIIERQYKKRMQDAEPGIAMQRVQHKIGQAKQAFALSLIEFDDKPTSLDATPLGGEFSHMNGETALTHKRKGRKRYMFFIQNRMWKVVDVYKLGSKSKWGVDFKQAVAAIEKKLGVPGRKLAADEKQKRAFEEVDWADSKTHLRLINMGKRLGIAYVDKDTEGNLANLRTHKPEKKPDIDPSVKAIIR
jgi:hypothetical protein